MAYISFDPYRQELISEYNGDSDKSLKEKIYAVHSEFSGWRNSNVQERCELLNRLADTITMEKIGRAHV